jgi:hypothetical protein
MRSVTDGRMMSEEDDEDDVKAISALVAALKPLDAESRIRVLDFVFKKLKISLSLPETPTSPTASAPTETPLPSTATDTTGGAARRKPR